MQRVCIGLQFRIKNSFIVYGINTHLARSVYNLPVSQQEVETTDVQYAKSIGSLWGDR